MSKRIINDDDYYTRNITDQYLHDINKIPLLDENEFQELFLEYKNGSESAKNKILVSNLRLSLGVARKYIGLGVPLIDLVCEGNFGLEEALKRYDPEKGKYSTYAYSWIDRYIRNAVPNQSKMVRFPITAYDDFIKYRRFVEKCPKLDKFGFCDDNYPDVIESKNKKFYIGVRFHPESLYKRDDKMNNIFKEFIVSCRKND